MYFSDTIDNHQSGDLAILNRRLVNIAGGSSEGTGSIETWNENGSNQWTITQSYSKLERLDDFTTATIDGAVFIFGGNVMTVFPRPTNEIVILTENSLEVLGQPWGSRFFHRTLSQGKTKFLGKRSM